MSPRTLRRALFVFFASLLTAGLFAPSALARSAPWQRNRSATASRCNPTWTFHSLMTPW